MVAWIRESLGIRRKHALIPKLSPKAMYLRKTLHSPASSEKTISTRLEAQTRPSNKARSIEGRSTWKPAPSSRHLQIAARPSAWLDRSARRFCTNFKELHCAVQEGGSSASYYLGSWMGSRATVKARIKLRLPGPVYANSRPAVHFLLTVN